MADDVTTYPTVSTMGTTDSTLTNNTSASFQNVKEQAVEQGSALVHQTKEVAGQALDTAKNQIKTQLTSQKDRAASSLESAVRALESTGSQFRDNDLGFVAGYTDNLTDQVRQFTQYVQDKDIEDLTRDVEAFARRNPAVFIGGAFLLGIAAARFLKSSNSSVISGNGGALMPISTNDNLPAPLSTTRTFVQEEANPAVVDTFGERPMTAHNYVAGIGINGNNSDL